MRWYLGYPVLAAGLAFGAHTYFPSDFDDLRPAASTLLSLETAHAAPLLPSAADEEIRFSRLTRFSPGPRFAEAGEPRGSVLAYLTSRLAALEIDTLAPAAPAAVQDVTVSPWRSAVVQEARLAPDASSTVAPRAALARDIQSELRRVGCYMGEIDGVWGVGSQRAMLMFMDRVNAALPTSEPDVFMLSLIRSQSTTTCGAACPQGQGLTSGGRCLPNAILAHAGKKGLQSYRQQVGINAPVTSPAAAYAPELAWAPETSGREPFSGRMSIGGPKPAADEAAAGRSRPEPVTAPAPLARTAALDPVDAPAIEGEGVPIAAAEAPPLPRAKSTSNRSKGSRSAGRRTGTYRHVQRLFEHPLGRM